VISTNLSSNISSFFDRRANDDDLTLIVWTESVTTQIRGRESGACFVALVIDESEFYHSGQTTAFKIKKGPPAISTQNMTSKAERLNAGAEGKTCA